MGFLVKLAGKELKEIAFYLEIAVENIIEGKIIAFPTNSVYGIGGNPLDLNVINRLFDIKFRDRSKGFLLLASDIEEASKIAEFNELAQKLADKYWPGQLTLILKKKDSIKIPPEVTANKNTIGLRVPENEIILEMLNILKSKERLGVIIGTSANYSGEPPCISGEEVAKKLLKLSTTIVDCTTPIPKFLRIGKIPKKEILEFLAE
jgi:L-threonylcarbamoyladenylate synthase